MNHVKRVKFVIFLFSFLPAMIHHPDIQIVLALKYHGDFKRLQRWS